MLLSTSEPLIPLAITLSTLSLTTFSETEGSPTRLPNCVT